MSSPDPPNYDWLYGDDPRAGARPGADHPNGVLPPTDGQRRRRRHGPSHPLAPEPATPRPAPPPRPRRRVPPVRLFATLVAVALIAWVTFLIVIPARAWSTMSKVDAWPTSTRIPDQAGTTYLLVGSDSRAGLSKKDLRRTGTGGVGDVGERTDTIMVLHVGRGPSLLLSIPRDSIVPIPGRGTTKINAAFALGGPRLLVETIEQNTGLRIDHYVEIGFAGFVNSVDAVGGIEICPKTRMVDPKANLNIKKGCQEADGVTALGYARSRYTSPIGDIDRARHQREVVAAVGKKARSPLTVLHPKRYTDIVNAGATGLTVSKGTSPLAVARFAWAMSSINSTGMTCSMPIRDLAVHWDEKRAKELLGYVIADNTKGIPKRLCRPTGLPR